MTTIKQVRKTRAPKGLETKADPKQEVAIFDQSVRPAYLAEMAPSAMDGLDASDLILPRIKLLQAISPEVEAYEAAKAGTFWHSVLAQVVGTEFRFQILSRKKKFLLMAPLGDPRGVLARAEDGVHWSPANETFEVKLKGVKETQKWTTAETVKASGLDQFGSSVAGDKDSKPAAVLVYEYLIRILDNPEITTPVIMGLARSQARKGKDLNSKVQMRGAPLQAMAFKAKIIEETGDEGPYKNFQFENDGWIPQDVFESGVKLSEELAAYKPNEDDAVIAKEPDVEAAATKAGI